METVNANQVNIFILLYNTCMFLYYEFSQMFTSESGTMNKNSCTSMNIGFLDGSIEHMLFLTKVTCKPFWKKTRNQFHLLNIEIVRPT